jgi:hypothetical protein
MHRRRTKFYRNSIEFTVMFGICTDEKQLFYCRIRLRARWVSGAQRVARRGRSGSLLQVVRFVCISVFYCCNYFAPAADVRTHVLADHISNQPFKITIKKEESFMMAEIEKKYRCTQINALCNFIFSASDCHRSPRPPARRAVVSASGFRTTTRERIASMKSTRDHNDDDDEDDIRSCSVRAAARRRRLRRVAHTGLWNGRKQMH